MDFSETNMANFLYNAIGNKFNDLSPQDFEDFCCQLFRDQGYIVTPTPYSSDFGADIIIEKGDSKIAVQVKQYSEGNNVGVQELNQILGAKLYYNCKSAICISTSDYTKQAQALAEQTGLILWDWEKLVSEISTTYWNGKDYYSFYKEHFIEDNDKNSLSFKLMDVNFDRWVEGKRITEIKFKVSNNSLNHVNLNFSTSPVFINSQKNQIKSLYNNSEDDKIYSGCNMVLSVYFFNSDVPKIEKGEELVFDIKENELEQSTVYFYEFQNNFSPKPKQEYGKEVYFDNIDNIEESKVDWKSKSKETGKILLKVIAIVGAIFVWFLSILLGSVNKK